MKPKVFNKMLVVIGPSPKPANIPTAITAAWTADNPETWLVHTRELGTMGASPKPVKNVPIHIARADK